MVGDLRRASIWSIRAVSLRARVIPISFRRLRDFSWLLLCAIALSGCAKIHVEPAAELPAPAKTDNELLVSIANDYGLVADESERGVRIYLPKLSFEYNSADLSSEAVSKIHFVALIVNSDLAMGRGVIVSGHADSLGTAQNNLKVSRLRAQVVTERLLSHGVKPVRLAQEWHGDERPIIPNQLADGSDNPEGRAVNRRVEIIILNP